MSLDSGIDYGYFGKCRCGGVGRMNLDFPFFKGPACSLCARSIYESVYKSKREAWEHGSDFKLIGDELYYCGMPTWSPRTGQEEKWK